MTKRCDILLGGDMWSLTIPDERFSSIRRGKWYCAVVIWERFMLCFLFEDVR